MSTCYMGVVNEHMVYVGVCDICACGTCVGYVCVWYMCRRMLLWCSLLVFFYICHYKYKGNWQHGVVVYLLDTCSCGYMCTVLTTSLLRVSTLQDSERDALIKGLNTAVNEFLTRRSSFAVEERCVCGTAVPWRRGVCVWYSCGWMGATF